MVIQQCKVVFKIGGYKDEIMCDVIPMDVCHVLLGRLWQYDRNVVHDGRKSTYTLEKNGCIHMFLPIEDKGFKAEDSPNILIMSGKELLNEVKEHEMQFFVVRNHRVILTRTYVDDMPVDIQEMFDKFVDIVVDELPHSLPPIKSMSHHIDLIPGASFPNKTTYRLTPQDNEKVKNQVQELLDKGLFMETCIPCIVPTMLSPKKYGGWIM
jgi:hypothetical protein